LKEEEKKFKFLNMKLELRTTYSSLFSTFESVSTNRPRDLPNSLLYSQKVNTSPRANPGLTFLSVRQCFVSRRGSLGVKDQTSNGGGGSCE
jgi:hypothetical protein